MSARIGKRMRALGIADQREYLQFVMNDTSGEEIVHLIDAISTNVTSFFREAPHFDFLSEVMARWYNEGQRRFRLWSAASSTGEEPYSLAITLSETLDSGTDVRLLATDISTRVLEKCVQGIYSGDRVETIPKPLLDKYFTPFREGTEIRYSVKAPLRKMVVFKRLNLSTPPYPMKGPLDVVFCRNVMIYFDNETRGRLLAEIHRLLKPGGYLMVGHAESLTGMMSNLKGVRPSIYVKN